MQNKLQVERANLKIYPIFATLAIAYTICKLSLKNQQNRSNSSSFTAILLKNVQIWAFKFQILTLFWCPILASSVKNLVIFDHIFWVFRICFPIILHHLLIAILLLVYTEAIERIYNAVIHTGIPEECSRTIVTSY